MRHAKISLGFWHTNGSPNLGRSTRPIDSQQKRKKENLLDSGLCRSGWTQGKTEGKRKKDKYMDLARELKKHESDGDTNCNWYTRHRHDETRHNWAGKLIYWELCKKLKSNYTNKRYMRNPEFVHENETHKLRWGFEI